MLWGQAGAHCCSEPVSWSNLAWGLGFSPVLLVLICMIDLLSHNNGCFQHPRAWDRTWQCSVVRTPDGSIWLWGAAGCDGAAACGIKELMAAQQSVALLVQRRSPGHCGVWAGGSTAGGVSTGVPIFTKPLRAPLQGQFESLLQLRGCGCIYVAAAAESDDMPVSRCMHVCCAYLGVSYSY